MDDRNRTLEKLTEENRKLKEDREILLDTLVQMNRTLNRLIEEYITGLKNRKKQAGDVPEQETLSCCQSGCVPGVFPAPYFGRAASRWSDASSLQYDSAADFLSAVCEDAYSWRKTYGDSCRNR